MSNNQLKYIPINDITPSSWNSQTQDEKTFNLLVDDILDNGILTAITVIPTSDDKYLILAGEHRWRAAQVAGETELPCLVLVDSKFTDTEISKMVSVRLNVLQGKQDPEKFLKIYQPLVQKHGKETMKRLLGFTDDKLLKKLVNQVTENAKKILPQSMHQQLEDSVSEVKAVEDLNLIVQNLFQQSGKTINQGFMVFTHGTQEHIYIPMTRRMKKSMDKALSLCRTTNKQLSEFLQPLFSDYLDNELVKLEVPEPQAVEDPFAEDSNNV